MEHENDHAEIGKANNTLAKARVHSRIIGVSQSRIRSRVMQA